MLVSIKWLEELLKTKLEIDSLKKISRSLGMDIEEQFNFAPEGIKIAKIEEIRPHPNLKNLSVLQVKTERIIQIVSADLNIKEDDFVLVVLPGVKLKGEIIKAKDFGGIKSAGVLVSEEELGLVEKSSEVIVLKEGAPGKDFKEYFDDLVVQIKVFPNRPDWLSMIGVARELAVGLGIKDSQKEHSPKQLNRPGNIPIKIMAPIGCPRYTARIFEDVNIKESPFWLRWRLHCMGMKGINNVVDITNLMMLLYGQPLHPFDLDLLKEGIIIRNAKPGEEFITLEGVVLKLAKEDLVIADKDGPIALAGIVGARCAQISSTTRRVLLESAYFNPQCVAHTSRRLGLKTEASIRFERGVDFSIVDETSRITGNLFKEYTRAKELEFIGLGKKREKRIVNFSRCRLNNFLGLNLTAAQIKKILKKVHICVKGKAILTAKIPHYRQDLQIEEDIYEELARLFGYANIPEKPTQRWVENRPPEKTQRYEEDLKNYLAGQGFNEIYNLSLVASKNLVDFGFTNFVKIKNPLNERFDALRPVLFFGLLDCVHYNCAKGNKSLKLFEIGNNFLVQEPYEEKRLGVIMGGELSPDFWGGKGQRLSYFDAKGTLEAVFGLFHITGIEFKPDQRSGFSQSVTITFSDTELGYLGCVAQHFCAGEYFYFELVLDRVWHLINEPFYIPPGRFPANMKDLSFLVDEKIEAPQIINTITKVGGPVLEKVSLFDYYKGDNLPSGKKNFGFRLYFRASDRTLTDTEIVPFIKKIVDKITEKFNASLRTKEKNWTN